MHMNKDKACPPGSMAKASIKALARKVVDTGLTVNDALQGLSDDDKTALLREMREIKKAGAVPMPGLKVAPRAGGTPESPAYVAAPVATKQPPGQAMQPPPAATAGQPAAVAQPPVAVAGKPPMQPPIKPGAVGAAPTAKAGQQVPPEQGAGTHEYHRDKALAHLHAAQAHAGAAASAKKVDQAQDHQNVVGAAQQATMATAGDQMAPPPVKKSMEPGVEKAAEAGKSMAKAGEGEGSRGGHIIGHTGSGKPIYAPSAAASAEYHSHSSSTSTTGNRGWGNASAQERVVATHMGKHAADFTAQDHADAARAYERHATLLPRNKKNRDLEAPLTAASKKQVGLLNGLNRAHGRKAHAANVDVIDKSERMVQAGPGELRKNNLTIDLGAEDELLDMLEKGQTAIGGQHASLRINERARLLGMRGERMAKSGGVAGGTIYQGEHDAMGSRGGDDRESVARAQVLEEMVELDEAGNKGQGGLAQWFADAWNPDDPSHTVPVGAVPGRVTTDGTEANGWRKSEQVEIIDDDLPYNRALVRAHPAEHHSSIRETYQRRG
jgi:hypothetical protein